MHKNRAWFHEPECSFVEPTEVKSKFEGKLQEFDDEVFDESAIETIQLSPQKEKSSREEVPRKRTKEERMQRKLRKERERRRRSKEESLPARSQESPKERDRRSKRKSGGDKKQRRRSVTAPPTVAPPTVAPPTMAPPSVEPPKHLRRRASSGLSRAAPPSMPPPSRARRRRSGNREGKEADASQEEEEEEEEEEKEKEKEKEKEEEEINLEDSDHDDVKPVRRRRSSVKTEAQARTRTEMEIPRNVAPETREEKTENMTCTDAGVEEEEQEGDQKCTLKKYTIYRNRNASNSRAGAMYTMYEEDENGMKTAVMKAAAKTKISSSKVFFFKAEDANGVEWNGNVTKSSACFCGVMSLLELKRNKFSIQGRNELADEVAQVNYNKMSAFKRLKDGVVPRRMAIFLPKRDKKSEEKVLELPQELRTGNVEQDAVLLSKNVRAMQKPYSCTEDMNVLINKAPVYINGFYRLDFQGRVTEPSVKNFQLTFADGLKDSKTNAHRDARNEDNDPAAMGGHGEVKVQFGKVGDDCFHLDADHQVLSPFVSFALAMTQFIR